MPDLLLRDLIDIPESVHRSDFVVSLDDGIARGGETVDRYVVTPQLVECFDKALGLVASALDQRSSKGAYLHGSFGSGKSHFMAVLHLLLSGDAHARSRKEFAPLLARYDGRLNGRRILLVPYHMVGAESMESKVLGGYVELIRMRHPEAPLPAVYLDESILEAARGLREKMGEQAFFANLGDGGEDEGFGDLVGGWDADRFEGALGAVPGDAERIALVSDYIDAYAPHIHEVAGAIGVGFVPFDRGLDAISQHARSLGYDAVLLFLDELILWFASRMSDQAFVSREGPKLAKLVEAAAQERPAPIISFIARQRDLRDFVGEGVPGAEAVNFDHILRYWEGRFDVIELSDTNLRAIVRERVLKPRSAAAGEELAHAFEQTFSRGGRAMDTHMTSEADREAFRSVYPFSPALVDTLVAVSNYLQRERTALRLLVQLLVARRDTLRVGDLVPMGDLYDVIRKGEDPFSDELARHFLRTRALYEQKFRPLLLNEHGLSEEDANRVQEDHPFRADDRLVKTLLLAALVGDAGPLRNLTVRRLADLNHGTIRTPIPGQERTAVLQRLQRWAPDIPELRLGEDEQDPTVSLRISGVDVQGVLDLAASVDNTGARRAKVKELVSEALELEPNGGLLPSRYSWIWRGSRRTVEVQFANIRDAHDLPASSFRAGDVPKVLIDYPFDEPGFSPQDDRARIDEVARDGGPTDTIAWLPVFLTDAALERLGKLVILDHVLSGDRFDGYTRHLSVQDRVEARHALENMRQAHRDHVRQFLRQAYGIETAEERWVGSDFPLKEQFPSLDPTLHLRPPTTATMKDAFDQLLDQVMTHRYPAHPEFEDEVRLADLRTALEHVRRAVNAPNQRVDVPAADRKSVRRVLQPLRLAVTGEAHMQLDRHWRDHFHRKQQEGGAAPVTVERLRGWMDEPKAMGLDERVGNLLILAYALMDDRVLLRAGLAVEPSVERLDPLAELRTQALPSAVDWEKARPLANAIFGIDASPIRNAPNVSGFVSSLKQAAESNRDSAVRLVTGLGKVPMAFRATEESDRRRTATAATKLLSDLAAASDVDAVGVLGKVAVPTSDQAMGVSIRSADLVARGIEATNWELLAGILELAGEWGRRAEAIRDRVRVALSRDEIVGALGPVLLTESRAATLLLNEAARGGPAPGATPPVPEPPVAAEAADVREQVLHASSVEKAHGLLEDVESSGEQVEGIEIRVRYRS